MGGHLFNLTVLQYSINQCGDPGSLGERLDSTRDLCLTILVILAKLSLTILVILAKLCLTILVILAKEKGFLTVIYLGHNCSKI